MKRWQCGEFVVIWSPSEQLYSIFKADRFIRNVYRWRDAKPYLD